MAAQQLQQALACCMQLFMAFCMRNCHTVTSPALQVHFHGCLALPLPGALSKRALSLMPTYTPLGIAG